ncbi:MAG: hypothetical protein ACLR23_06025 [Clostridia bacterium]
MHAGEMKKGRGQRAHGGKFPAGSAGNAHAGGEMEENARRRGEERQGLACKRRQLRPQRRNDHAGEEIGRKMHAGEMKKGRGQRAHGGNSPAGRVETPEPAEKRKKMHAGEAKNDRGQRAKEANSQRRRRNEQASGETE